MLPDESSDQGIKDVTGPSPLYGLISGYLFDLIPRAHRKFE